MSIEKTAKGRLALESRVRMAPRARQLLLLCDGRRTLAELTAIFGTGTEQALLQLQAAGLLRGVDQPAAAVRESGAMPPRARTRSLAACKVYAVDILQLQQDAAASHLVGQLRQCEQPQPILELVLVALHLILERSGERYAERVAGRIFEIVPDAHLGRFVELAEGTRVPVLQLLAQRYRRCLMPA
ncbi:hypothetical protein AAV94_00485 [Lampropedia cohaerens]|uniref:Uncharacterized protein n=1 Tax=Lampropedia cohaerens TaxID=1610491 RepID=A0A0U1Q3A6_9BURK|nr:hypothetical protein [Lampropedia cohaerens]KKW69248.1 hypothetical protein AAV94_00485 [Lampropedia cohaerens]